MSDPRGALPNHYYTIENGAFVPTRLCENPWTEHAQAGHVVAALMAHTLEASGETGGGSIARFTLDILSPAPMAPTKVIWRIVRPGRRVRLLEGLFDAGGVRAQARVLVVAPDAPHPEAPPLTPPKISPEAAPRTPIAPRETGLETRLVHPREKTSEGFRTRQAHWLRIAAEITPGVKASPLALAMTASDTGGASLGETAAGYGFPNLDVSVHFSRQPHGEWALCEVEPMMLGGGVCVADHVLSDERGVFARAHQTLFFTERGAA